MRGLRTQELCNREMEYERLHREDLEQLNQRETNLDQ